MFDYLKFADSPRHFPPFILKNFIKDHWTTHAERINNNRNLVVLKSGDIGMAGTTIRNDLSKKRITKLCYAVRYSYQIICSTDHGSYYVQKFNKPDSPNIKFMDYDVYPLSLSHKHREHIDTTYTCYFNQTHTPIVNRLKKVLNVEFYNDK